ncbi:energy transducer TonB [Hymenobacter arizonensis]|uniref:TonB protein C-terminal n=1 Tax=Hymenobacter arizonensis TaxID=1227077 RepID=A0A1I6BNP4_HYMAR|nr:energy transducer TonB [Hymenobacter arizonensis]SFQ82572.1 TonB protein C-terminal [Hymenobacter arizonensis]
MLFLICLLVLIGGLVLFARWLRAKQAPRYWLAPGILLGCLLLAAGVDMLAYQHAYAVSYTGDEGWTSETVYYTPDYDGEEEALALVLCGPLVGMVILLLYSIRGQRGWQFGQYAVLLTCYPFAALVLFFPTDNKPRYYEGAALPFVADSLRVVTRYLPHKIYRITHSGDNAFAQTHPEKRANKPVAVPAAEPELPGPLRGARVWNDPSTRRPIKKPFDFNSIFTEVEQMPTLNGQYAVTASMAAIHRSLVVPPGAPDGRVFVSFNVDKKGRVRHPRIDQGLRADVDSAVIAATRQLPPFVPGRHAGQAVTVHFWVPVTIPVKK